MFVASLAAAPAATYVASGTSSLCGLPVSASSKRPGARRLARRDLSFHGAPAQPSFEPCWAVALPVHAAAGEQHEPHARREPAASKDELLSVLEDRIRLDHAVAVEIVEKFPRLMNFPIERPLGAVEFLTSKGISAADIARMVVKYPMLLSFSVERRLMPVWHMLEEEGLDAAQVAVRYPPIFDHNLKEGIRGKLQTLEAAGMSPQALRARVLKEGGAAVLRLGTEEKLRPWLAFFAEVGIPPERVEEIVRRHPWVFKRDLDRKVRPMLAALREEGGLQEEDVAHVLTKCPQAFGVGRDAVVPKLKLLYNLGLDPEEVRHTLVAAPYFLTLDLQTNLKAKVAFLNAAGIRGDELHRVAAACPVMWGMDLEGEMAPRFDALLNTMGRSVREVAKRPQSLFYASLQRAILPRHAYLQHRGLDPAKLSLQRLLECTDTAFVRDVAGGELQEYKDFKRRFEAPPAPARA